MTHLCVFTCLTNSSFRLVCSADLRHLTEGKETMRILEPTCWGLESGSVLPLQPMTRSLWSEGGVRRSGTNRWMGPAPKVPLERSHQTQPSSPSLQLPAADRERSSPRTRRAQELLPPSLQDQQLRLLAFLRRRAIQLWCNSLFIPPIKSPGPHSCLYLPFIVSQ